MPPITRNRVRRIAAGKGHRLVRGKLWQALRILRTFTVADLLAVAELADSKRKSVLGFLYPLRRTGYLRVRYVGPRGEAVFQLVRDTGPLPPALVRNHTVVWDQNTATEYPVGYPTKAPNDAR